MGSTIWTFHLWMANMVLAGVMYYLTGIPEFGLVSMGSAIGASFVYCLHRRLQ